MATSLPFAAIQFDEQPVGGRNQILVIGETVGRKRDATEQLGHHFGSLL